MSVREGSQLQGYWSAIWVGEGSVDTTVDVSPRPRVPLHLLRVYRSGKNTKAN